MEKKTDRRVIKTKHAIFKAFVELLNEKDVNQITITDIAKKRTLTVRHFIITIQMPMKLWKK